MRQGQGLGRNRGARAIDGDAAQKPIGQREGVAELRGDSAQHAGSLGRDLGPDAVAGQNQN